MAITHRAQNGMLSRFNSPYLLAPTAEAVTTTLARKIQPAATLETNQRIAWLVQRRAVEVTGARRGRKVSHEANVTNASRSRPERRSPSCGQTKTYF